MAYPHLITFANDCHRSVPKCVSVINSQARKGKVLAKTVFKKSGKTFEGRMLVRRHPTLFGNIRSVLRAAWGGGGGGGGGFVGPFPPLPPPPPPPHTHTHTHKKKKREREKKEKEKEDQS